MKDEETLRALIVVNWVICLIVFSMLVMCVNLLRGLLGWPWENNSIGGSNGIGGSGGTAGGDCGGGDGGGGGGCGGE